MFQTKEINPITKTTRGENNNLRPLKSSIKREARKRCKGRH